MWGKVSWPELKSALHQAQETPSFKVDPIHNGQFLYPNADLSIDIVS